MCHAIILVSYTYTGIRPEASEAYLYTSMRLEYFRILCVLILQEEVLVQHE